MKSTNKIELKELKLQFDKENDELEKMQELELKELMEQLGDLYDTKKSFESISKDDWKKTISEYSTEEMQKDEFERNAQDMDVINSFYQKIRDALNHDLEAETQFLNENNEKLDRLQQERGTLEDEKEIGLSKDIEIGLKYTISRNNLEIRRVNERREILEKNYDEDLGRAKKQAAIGNNEFGRYLSEKELNLLAQIQSLETYQRRERYDLEEKHQLHLRQYAEYTKVPEYDRSI